MQLCVDRSCVCHLAVRECGNLSLTNCAEYDKLLFHECYTSVAFALSLPPPKVCGRVSSFGIASDYGLDGLGSNRTCFGGTNRGLSK